MIMFWNSQHASASHLPCIWDSAWPLWHVFLNQFMLINCLAKAFSGYLPTLLYSLQISEQIATKFNLEKQLSKEVVLYSLHGVPKHTMKSLLTNSINLSKSCLWWHTSRGDGFVKFRHWNTSVPWWLYSRNSPCFFSWMFHPTYSSDSSLFSLEDQVVVHLL